MVIQLPDRAQLPPGPHRDLVEAMHSLYEDAGRPGSRTISIGIRRNRDLDETVSHETVSALLSGKSVPAWGKIRSIVIQLDRTSDEPHDLRKLLGRMRRLWLAVPAAPARTVRRDDATVRPRHVRPVALAPDRDRASPDQAGSVDTGSVDAATSADPVPADGEPLDGGPADAATSAATGPADRSSTGIAPLDDTDRIEGPLPERNPHFIGREILLDLMAERLRAPHTSPLVLYGLGGAGKTQLAREYIEQHAAEYLVVWWIPAARAGSALTELAERLQVPARNNADQTVDNVIRALETGRFRFLLVFDGVEDEDVRRYFPVLGGHIIVTTRDPVWANDSNHLPLEVPDFDRAEAIQFLRKRFPELPGTEADDLAETHGRLPLALEQIAALKVASGMPWDELHSRLDEPGPGLLDTGQPTHYPYTVAALLRLALDQLRRTNPVAVGVFELFAFLGSEPVSVALLSVDRPDELSPDLARTMRHPIGLRKVIEQISRFGLARLHRETQRIEVQPLMRLAMRDALTAEARERARRNVHAILAAADPGWPDDLASRDMHREIAAHVLPAGLVDSAVRAARLTVLHQIRYRYLIGEYKDADVLATHAVNRWSATAGADDKLVLLCTREWANVVRALGQYRHARELTTRTIGLLRDNPAYGPDHRDTLALATSHAADLRIAGRYQDAYDTDTDTYGRYLASKAHGESHPLTLASLHNLAVSCRHLGRFAEAEAKDRLELALHAARHSTERAEALLTVNALTEDLYGLGRYREVLELHARHADAARRVLGPTHKGVLLAARTVALAQLGLGEAAASSGLREHYQDCITSFGAAHEYTLAATMSYANALRRHGRRDQIREALVLAQEAVGTYQRTFGPRNPLTLAAEVNRASVLRACDDLTPAHETDKVAHQALQDQLGDHHPYTIAALVNLATDLARTGDREDARRRSEQAYELACAVRGDNHPDALAAGGNLALDLAATGAGDAAERLLEQVLAGLRRSLGPAHPTVTEVASGARVDCAIEPPPT